MVASWTCVAALLMPQEPAPQAQIEQKHDVSVLLGAGDPLDLAFDLAPVSGAAPKESLRRALPAFVGTDLVELVTRLLKSGGVTEELKLDSEDEDEAAKLDVLASPAVQKEVDRLLKMIEEAMRGPSELEIRVLELEPDAPSSDDRATLDVADAERREAELLQSKRAHLVRVVRGRPIDGRVTTLAAADSRRFVQRYSVELGLGPLHYQPVESTSAEGLTAKLRSARLAGATRLVLALRCAETLEPARSLEVDPVLWYHEPRSDSIEAARAAGRVDVGARMFHGKVPLRLDLPVRRFMSLAGTFVLPDGKALWIPSRVAAKSGTSSWLAVIRQRGPAPPIVTRLSRDGDARQLALVHVGGLENWTFDPLNYGRQSFDTRGFQTGSVGDKDESADDRWPSIITARPAATRGPDLPTSFAPFEIAGKRTEAELLGSQWLLVDAPTLVERELRDRFAAELVPPTTFEIHGRILRAGMPAAEFRLPVVAGGSATLWSGFDGAALRTWDVDVADIEQIGVPLVAWHLDGFALTFAVDPIGAGMVAVTTRGVVSLVEALPSPTATGNPETPTVERLRTHRLVVSDASSIGSDGKEPIALGGSACSLEVSVVAR
jgi:hypothetical protein